MSDDGVTVIHLVRKERKCLVRQYASGWFLPYSLENRRAHASLEDLIATSMLPQLVDMPLEQPASVLRVDLEQNLSVTSIAVNFVLRGEVDESVFERDPNHVQKWVNLRQLEASINSDSERPDQVLLGPEPLVLLSLGYISFIRSFIRSTHGFEF